MQLYMNIGNTYFEEIYRGKDIETAIRVLAHNVQTLQLQIYTDATELDAYITDDFGNIVFIAKYNMEGI